LATYTISVSIFQPQKEVDTQGCIVNIGHIYHTISVPIFQPQKEEDTQRHSDSSLEEKVFKQAPKELTEEKRRSARRRE
jgi:hypothetical protein